MSIIKKIKKIPNWLIGGLGCLGVYIVSALILLLVFVVGGKLFDQNPNLLPPGSLFILIPFMAVFFYPGIIFTSSYEKFIPIIIINIVFYFIVGVLIGIIFSSLKKRKNDLDK